MPQCGTRALKVANLVRARKDCAAKRSEGAESVKFSSGEDCAAMRSEGAESGKFSSGEEGLCRNAGRGH